MVTGRREFRRTTSLTEISVDLSAVKQSQNEQQQKKKSGDEGESSVESPREYTRMRRRSINIPTPHNYYSNTYAEETASFLTTCGLCQRRLPPARDIFMYRGDTAYCSVECREEQMEYDERKEQCSSITNSPPPPPSPPASIAKDHDFSHHILDHSPAACDPAATKPGTLTAA